MSSILLDTLKKQGYVKTIPADVRNLYKKLVERNRKKCISRQRVNYRKFLDDPLTYLEGIKTDEDFINLLCLVRLLSVDKLQQVIRKLKGAGIPLLNPREGIAALFFNLLAYRKIPFIDVFKAPLATKKTLVNGAYPGPQISDYVFLNKYADKPYKLEEYLAAFTRADEKVKAKVRLDAFYSFIFGDFSLDLLGYDDLIDYVNSLYEDDNVYNLEAGELLPTYLGAKAKTNDFIKQFSCSDLDKLDDRVILDMTRAISLIYNLDFDWQNPPESFFDDIHEYPGSNLFDCLFGYLTSNQELEVDINDPESIVELVDKYTPKQFLDIISSNKEIKTVIDELKHPARLYNVIQEIESDADAFATLMFFAELDKTSVDADLVNLLFDRLEDYGTGFDELFDERDDLSFYDLYFVAVKDNPNISNREEASLARRILDYINEYGGPSLYSEYDSNNLIQLFGDLAERSKDNKLILEEVSDFSTNIDLGDSESFADNLIWIEGFREFEAVIKLENIPGWDILETGKIAELFSKSYFTPLFASLSYPFYADLIKEINKKTDIESAILEISMDVDGFIDDDLRERIKSKVEEIQKFVDEKDWTFGHYFYKQRKYAIIDEDMRDVYYWSDVLTDELDREVEGNPALIGDALSNITYGTKPVMLEHEFLHTVVAKVTAVEILYDILKEVVGKPCQNTTEKIVDISKSDFDIELKVETPEETLTIDGRIILTAALPALKKTFDLQEKDWEIILRNQKFVDFQTNYANLPDPHRLNRSLIQYIFFHFVKSISEEDFNKYFEERPYKRMMETEKWIAEVVSQVKDLSSWTLKPGLMNTFSKIFKSSYKNELKKLTEPIKFEGDFSVLVTSNPYNVANMSAADHIYSCQRLYDYSEYPILNCMPDMNGFSALQAAFRRTLDFIFLTFYDNEVAARLTGTLSFEEDDKNPVIYFGEGGNIYGEITGDESSDSTLCPTEDCLDGDDEEISKGASITIQTARAILRCIFNNVKRMKKITYERPQASLIYG